jgi:hypothetical protein
VDVRGRALLVTLADVATASTGEYAPKVTPLNVLSWWRGHTAPPLDALQSKGGLDVRTKARNN